MVPSGLYIDANLLVLLVVGLVGPDIIGKHRRTSDFTIEDHRLLVGLVDCVDQVFVTPTRLPRHPIFLRSTANPNGPGS